MTDVTKNVYMEIDELSAPKPEFALVFHSSSLPVNSEISMGNVRNTHSFATKHDIISQEDNLMMGAGKPMTTEGFEEILKNILSLGSLVNEVMPENIISMSNTQITWVEKAKERKMTFRLGGKTVTYLVPYPNLIMKASSTGKLDIASYKTRGRVTEKTILYHAPLMNIYKTGNVCIGNSSLPNNISIKDIPEWADLIFNTAYSHVNQSKTLSISGSKEVGNKEHLKFWRELSKSKVTKFPNSALVPMGMKVGEFLNA